MGYASPKGLLNWSGKLVYTLLDQALFSGSNFVVSLILVRFVGASTYGIFSIAYSFFLFAASIYNSLVLEPINVLGPKNHDKDLISYDKQSIKLHTGLTALMAGIGLLSCLIMKLSHSPDAYIELTFFISLSLPFILLFWLASQCAYMETKPQLSMLGSACYAILYLGGTLFLALTHRLQIDYVFIMMAAAGTISGLLVFNRLGVRYSFASITRIFGLPTIIQENWSFGKWILFASIAYGLNTLIYSPLIGFTLGVEQAGIFRGMQNYFQPFTLGFAGLCILMTPYLSRRRFNGPEGNFRRLMLILIGIGACMALIYSVVIFIFARPLVAFVYNSSVYNQNIWIIPYLGLSTLIMTINVALGVWYRVMEKTRFVFYGRACGAIAVFLLSVPLMLHFQMKGALIGLNLSLLVELIILLVFGSFQLRMSERK